MDSEVFRVGPFDVPDDLPKTEVIGNLQVIPNSYVAYRRTGWVCPRCERGINPDISVCPYCPITLAWASTTYGTNATSGSNGPDGHSFEP